MRVKRLPPFDFFGQTLFLTVLSKVDVKTKVHENQWFLNKILSQNVSKLIQHEEKHLTLPYDFGIFETGKCSFLGKSTGKSTFSIKCSFMGIICKYLKNLSKSWVLKSLQILNVGFMFLSTHLYALWTALSKTNEKKLIQWPQKQSQSLQN